MTSQTRRTSSPSEAARTPLAEAHRRVVEIHYALASADELNEDVHTRTLDRLSELLEFLDDAAHAESPASASHFGSAPDRS